jgi:DNA-binding SARP family transcriptional activator/Tfp pilus assembly protein PilF
MPPHDPTAPPGVTPVPPLRVLLLGSADLRDTSGIELVAILSQPKRLALLAYLLLAEGRRWHRRDQLVATFWPELDTEHARAALRRALYFLRRELGKGILTGRATEEIGLPPEMIWCDVIECWKALRAGDAERALELYRGDLLQGLYVAGAPEAERWLEVERTALREAAAKAAWELADAGSGAAAAGWAKRAAALAPLDEAAIQRLMRRLADLGDRTGALQAYDEFTRRLQADLQLDPDASTVALVQRLRAASTARRTLGETPAPVASGTSLVVVAPFTIKGPARLDYLGPAMMELLSTTLHGAGPYRTVDSAAVMTQLGRKDAAVDLVGRHFGASYLVTGSIIEAGGRLRATVALSGIDGSNLARLEEEVESESGIFDLADRTTRALLSTLGGSSGLPLAASAARTTNSARALKAWVTGEHAYREGRVKDAALALREALSHDPEFALAHYRLACALGSGGMVAEARSASSAARERRARLGDHDRQLVEAHHAWLMGAQAEADRRAETLVLTYPESLQGWFLLGDVRFHGNPDRGRSVTEARAAFERVLLLDPEHTGALMHLARLDALEGARETARARIDRVLSRCPAADLGFALKALRAFLVDDPAEQQRVLDALPGATAIAMVNAFADVAVCARNLEGAEQLGRSALAIARSDEFRALCHVALAHILYAANRAAEAMAEVEHLPALRVGWAVAMRAHFRTLPFAHPERRELEQDRDILAAAEPAEIPSTLPPPLQLHDAMAGHLRHYLLALVCVRLGDPQSAAHALEALAETQVPVGAELLIEDMMRTIQAELHRARGRSQDALDALGHPVRGPWYQTALFSPFFAGIHQRLLRALLLEDLGRTTEARAWWHCIAERSPFELVALARHEVSLGFTRESQATRR